MGVWSTTPRRRRPSGHTACTRRAPGWPRVRMACGTQAFRHECRMLMLKRAPPAVRALNPWHGSAQSGHSRGSGPMQPAAT
eukprot:5184019-Prymnesium_polylepis.1